METLAHKAQVAALPVKGKPGQYRVLLVTSRETRRWIIPKGWPMKGRKDHDAAAQEALEEAGVSGRIHKHPMGAYTYEKRLANGTDHVSVMVYLLEVEKEAGKWPEKDERRREWLSAKEAAERVDEPALAAIIMQLDVGPLELKPEPVEPAPA